MPHKRPGSMVERVDYYSDEEYEQARAAEIEAEFEADYEEDMKIEAQIDAELDKQAGI